MRVGRDATREFEDVGHSGDARSRLDALVIGTVRPATDEELRISRNESGDTKSTRSAAGSSDSIVAWMWGSMSSPKTIGAIGAASVAVVVTAVVLQRYGGKGFISGSR